MFRRSVAVLSKNAKRTIVRDPRKQKVPAIRAEESRGIQPTETTHQRQPMAFEPSPQNQQSVGSSLASYALAGAGMAIGFTIVGAVFGGF
jgi:hypothetical protein